MQLYFGAPFSLVNRKGLGYALSHEMNDDRIIENYSKTKHLILDNGADELGEGQGGSQLAYLAGRLQPEYIILPDTLHRDRKTRKNGLKFYKSMKNSGYKGKFISVIQAKTLDKGLESYRFWDESGIVDRIGVTYDTKIETVMSETLPRRWGKRLGFLEYLAHHEVFNRGNGTGIHMLGTLDVNELYVMHNEPRFSRVLDLVVSHDTTSPYACPTKFMVTTHGIEFGRLKDWEPLDFSKKVWTVQEMEVINWNLACYLTSCKVPITQWTGYMTVSAVESLYKHFEKFYG